MKELPYFKFEPGQWANGKIQMCAHETKGVFIDLCSMYWARGGDMPYALALQKQCKGNNDALQELESIGIIGQVDDKIIIQFLDEQLAEFFDISEKRAESARKRWNNANAMQMQCKSNARRGEKRREEERREKKSGIVDLPLPFGDGFKNVWLEWLEYSVQKKRKLTLLGAKKQLKFLSSFSEEEAAKMLNQSMINGWAGIFQLKYQSNGKQSREKEHPAEVAARAFSKRVSEEFD